MIVDAIRALVAWLEDPATGVNAQLPAVPRDAGDAAPPSVRVFDETRHPWVARGQVDRGALRDGPILLVHVAEELALETLPGAEAGEAVVSVAVRYAAKGAGGEALAADAYQTHRCVHRAIAAQFESAITTHVRNGVRLSAPNPVQYVPLVTPLEDSVVVGASIVPIPAHDPWALAIT
jgi:hypothetical protein